MPRPHVHLRNRPVINLDARVSGPLERLRAPVRRFLEQPGSEARALFQKIFNAFAESPLLGLSALAGMVGLFAYAKALCELETIPVYVGSLISAADVTAFGVRLGVPFVLLALAVAAVVFGLIAILAIDHRNERKWYWGLTIAAVICCGGLLTLYVRWADPGGYELNAVRAEWPLAVVTVVFALLAIVAFDHRSERGWCWGLTIAAVISCVSLLTLCFRWADSKRYESFALVPEWQLTVVAVVFGLLAILAFYRRSEAGWYWGLTSAAVISCGSFLIQYVRHTDPGGYELLALLAAWLIASTLLLRLAWLLYKHGSTPGIKLQDEFQRRLLSLVRRIAHPGPLLLGLLIVGLYLTIFSNYSILFDPPLGKWPRDSLCSNLLVLVTRSPDGWIYADRATALGSVLLVQRVDDSVSQWRDSGACPRSSGKKGAKHVPETHWLVLQSADVLCVRPYGARKECDLADRPPPPPPGTGGTPGTAGSTGTAPPPLARGPASIAQYAQTFLDCDPASFKEPEDALVFNFQEGHPGREPGKRSWTHDFRTASMFALTLPGLDGVRGAAGDKRDPEEFVRRAATPDPREKLWVLGFASVSGHVSSNADLSENRARVVLHYLNHSSTESSTRSLGGRARGLGANLLSGVGRAQQDVGEQIAVAFLCRDEASSGGATGRTSTQVELPRE